MSAGLGLPAAHALVSLLALNGPQRSEATGTDIEALGAERGRQTLAVPAKEANKAVIRFRMAI